MIYSVSDTALVTYGISPSSLRRECSVATVPFSELNALWLSSVFSELYSMFSVFNGLFSVFRVPFRLLSGVESITVG